MCFFMDSLRLLQLVPYWSDHGVFRAALVRPILAASIVIVIAARHAAGSDPAAAPIATDRPAATDSSVVVPPGSLQAGNGFAESVNQGQSTFDAPGTLLRFGMASKTELRLTAPDYFRQVGIGSGFGDLVVGIKQQLGLRQAALTFRSSYRSVCRRALASFRVTGMIHSCSCPGREHFHPTGQQRGCYRCIGRPSRAIGT